jgi:hypothetical protein
MSADSERGARMLRDFVPRMPTEAEMRATSLRWLEPVGPTMIDRWPAELAALSMPTKFIPFPWDGFEALFEPKGDEMEPALVEAAKEIDAAIGWNRHFPRLNTRSPKDCLWPFEALATLSGKEAVAAFAGSERALDDLCRLSHIKDVAPAFICLREWQYGLRAEREFRCFVKDGELIAVTHYDYHNPMAAPVDGGRLLREMIDNWFATSLKPVLHIDTVVFDLWWKDDGSFLLIEINPYGLSDPCFFKSYQNVDNASSYVQFAMVPA